MDAQHTLVKTSDLPAGKSKAPLTKVVKGLILRAPYSDWNPKKMIIHAPAQGSAKGNSQVTFSTCKFEYEYTLPDGTPKRAPLKIEFPNQIGKMAKSLWGFAEVLVFVEPEKLAALKKEDPNYKQEGTGKYSVSCSLPAGQDTTIAFVKVMQDIYDKCCQHLSDYGTEGNTPMLPGKYIIDKPGPSNLLENFAYPVSYKKKDGFNAKGAKLKVPDLLGDVSMHMSVNFNGRYGVEILDQEGKTKTYEDLLGQGFEHVPLMVIDDLFIGAKMKIRRKLDSTIITEILPPRTMEQGEALAEIKARAARSATDLLDEAADAFNDPIDELETGQAGEYSHETGDGYEEELPTPEPIATPAMSVISPARPTSNAARPSGSARALVRNVPTRG